MSLVVWSVDIDEPGGMDRSGMPPNSSIYPSSSQDPSGPGESLGWLWRLVS